MKILIADKFEKAGIDGLRLLGCELIHEPDVGADGLAASLDKNKPILLVVRSTKVPAATVNAAREAGVKVIVRAGAGVDNIDVAAATQAGIKVCNCPGMNAIAVAELAFGLILACDRRIVEQTLDARTGKWNKKEYGRTGLGGAKGLKGATLGVVGAGAIGRAVIKRAVAFEMEVVVWSRGITPEHTRDIGAVFGGTETPDLLNMAARCDFITIHLPLAPDTKGLIGTAFFERMKPGATIVNTSRGGVIDEAALREAMKSKGIRAGLDVWEGQPGSSQTAPGEWPNETARLPLVAATHHIGASTDQAQDAIAREVVRMVWMYKASGRVENSVNA
ncbi:MAG: NAD(P)-dependent oxidoreductase [Planctomycetota bacterium]